MSTPEQNVSEQQVASSLSQLGEATTAGELLRSQGQSKKVKVISEKKLMEWIMAMLRQHLAGRADTFSDQEKEELLRKTQEELGRRMRREAEAEQKRQHAETELQATLARLDSTELTRGELDETMAQLKIQLAEAEGAKQDLQQDVYDLQDTLQEKLNLLSTTLVDKDKLNQTVRAQMLRMTGLVEGVMGIDQQYYGGRHADENPVAEDSEGEEQFYHDFDVGAHVITTLGSDLERLRSIATNAEQDAANPHRGLLEQDLVLLEQLKSGSLSAIDVAAPVAGLIEALEGARNEAERLEDAILAATGNSSQRAAFTAVPDADGEPAEVLAGATTVTRELASELARTRQRVDALKQIADEADAERNRLEEEGELVRAAHRDLLAHIEERAQADALEVPSELSNDGADAATRTRAAYVVLDQMGATSETGPINERLAAINQMLGDDATALTFATTSKEAGERQGQAIALLERLVLRQRAELAAARAREAQVAAEAKALAKDLQHQARDVYPDSAGNDALVNASLTRLDQALASDEADVVAEATREVILSLQQQAQAQAAKLTETDAIAARRQAEAQAATAEQIAGQRAMARELVRAAQGDAVLAMATADLARDLEQAEPSASQPRNLERAVTKLAERKQVIEQERRALADELGRSRSRVDQVETELAGTRAELARARSDSETQAAATRELAARIARAASEETGTTSIRKGSATGSVVRAHASADPAEAALAQIADRRRQQAAELSRLEGEIAIREHRLTGLQQLTEQANQDAATLRRQLDTADLNLAAKHRQERNLAQQLVRAAEKDEQLADASADLALALEEGTGEGPLPVDVHDHLLTCVAMLAEQKRRLADEAEALRTDLARTQREVKDAEERIVATEGERDEMALSGKEIITRLTAQRDGRDSELKELRGENEAAAAKLADWEGRMQQAEGANRRVGEALAQLAQASESIAKAVPGAQSVEGPRIDLEVALQQLPGEGETDVVMPKDIALQIADSAERLAAALAARARAAAEAVELARGDHLEASHGLDLARGELTAIRNQLDESQTAARRARLEAEAVRRELGDQGTNLAAKVQELSTARGDLAMVQSDLSVASERLATQDVRLKKAEKELEQAHRDLEWVRGERERFSQRAELAEEAQLQTAQALRQLGNVGDSAAGDAVAKAASKLEMAKGAGGEDMANAGRELAGAVVERVRHLRTDLEQSRRAATEAKVNLDRQNTEVANLRGAVVDRDHTIRNLGGELAKAQDATAATRQDLDGARSEAGQLQERITGLSRELDMAQGEIAELRARDDASSGHTSDEVRTLRSTLETANAEVSRLQSQVRDLAERADAGDAKLKRQREELTFRLNDRDHTLAEKDAQIEGLLAQRADVNGLAAQVTSLNEQLSAASKRVAELEGLTGANVGSAVRSGDLSSEIRRLQGEIGQMRQSRTQIEAELTDAKAEVSERDSKIEKLRSEFAVLSGQVQSIKNAKDTAKREHDDEVHKLQKEKIGLEAKLRRLSESR